MTQPQQQRTSVVAAAPVLAPPPSVGLVGHAEALQAILGDLGTVTVAQLVQLFRQHGTQPDFPATLYAAFPQIVRPHAEAAAQITAQWFNDIVPDANAQPVVDLPPERVTKTLDWALHAPTKESAPAESEESSIKSPPSLDETLSRLSGSTKRMVLDASRTTVITNSTGQTRYARYASANACAFCRLLATRTDEYLYRTSKSAARVAGRGGKARGTQALGEKYHDHCVPAGTLVSGPRTEAAYRRIYEGEAVVIHTASGQQLTITPNHPVLTDQGWIPAGVLQHGDHVIRALYGDSGAATVPHKHQKPALIEDVWGSLAVDRLVRVPGSAEDFHGDGMHRDVDVVGADGGLDVRFVSALVEHGEQLSFAAALRCRVGSGLPVLGESAALIPAAGHSAHSIMGGRGHSGTLVGTCARHANFIGAAAASWFDAKFYKSPTNDYPFDTELLAYRQLGELLIDIELSDLFGVDVEPVSPRFDPAAFHFTADDRDAYASLGLDLLDRLAGHIEMDCIVQLDRIGFSDHVYNLQTVEGWYSAAGLIVSNCRCIAVPIPAGENWDAPDYVGDWQLQYQAARDDGNTSLTDILAHMRANTNAR